MTTKDHTEHWIKEQRDKREKIVRLAKDYTTHLCLAAILLLSLLPALHQVNHLLVLENSLVATPALRSLNGEATELFALDGY